MSKWQPIESAPKDGTKIIGVSCGQVGIYRWNEQKYHKKPKPYWERPYHPVNWDLQWQPTHWMPLPAPPEPAGGKWKEPQDPPPPPKGGMFA